MVLRRPKRFSWRIIDLQHRRCSECVADESVESVDVTGSIGRAKAASTSRVAVFVCLNVGGNYYHSNGSDPSQDGSGASMIVRSVMVVVVALGSQCGPSMHDLDIFYYYYGPRDVRCLVSRNRTPMSGKPRTSERRQYPLFLPVGISRRSDADHHLWKGAAHSLVPRCRL